MKKEIFEIILKALKELPQKYGYYLIGGAKYFLIIKNEFNAEVDFDDVDICLDNENYENKKIFNHFLKHLGNYLGKLTVENDQLYSISKIYLNEEHIIDLFINEDGGNDEIITLNGINLSEPRYEYFKCLLPIYYDMISNGGDKNKIKRYEIRKKYLEQLF